MPHTSFREAEEHQEHDKKYDTEALPGLSVDEYRGSECK
jgi:hypothetical protein